MKGEDFLRLFVGVYPPVLVAETLLEAAALIERPTGRAMAPEMVHLTLLFMGRVRRGELDATIESVERSAAGLAAFSLTPERLMTLPRGGRARLLAATTEAPGELLELQRRLTHRLAHRVGRKHAGFLPHMTLIRFGHGARAQAVDERIEVDSFRVDEIRVMRSELGSTGARHTAVANVKLG